MSDNLLQLEIKHAGRPLQKQLAPMGVYPVGSEQGNKIIIPDASVARRHAILLLREDGFFVEDLGSNQGTMLDGAPVRGRAAFQPGQEIRCGDYSLVVRRPAAPPPHESAPPPAAAGAMPETPRIDPEQEQRRQMKRQIHTVLLERLDMKRLTASRIQEEDLHRRVRQTLEQIVREVHQRLPAWIEPAVLIKEIYDEAVGLGPLEDMLADPEITEIMVNRHDQIYVEKHGRLILSDRVFLDDASVLAIIERIVAPIGRRIDESQPYVDARLKDGSRVNAIIPPLALSGPCLTIRKFARDALSIADLIRLGALTPAMSEFLRLCVILRRNIIVAGGTGSGKTTLLNVLSSFLPHTDRIVTIEDSAELRLSQAHVVRLESRPPNMEGRGAVTIRDLLRNALRMRPDRIIIGECRGGESLDMLQAMNTGHDGSLTTVHANSPRDVISRLETMTLMSGIELPSRAIREQIASAINLIIQTARLSDGSRKVTAVTEVAGLEGDRITMQDIFVFKQTGLDANGRVIGTFRPSGSVPTFIEDLRSRDLKIDMSMFEPSAFAAGR
jgi:pilus assembly protein CpaF